MVKKKEEEEVIDVEAETNVVEETNKIKQMVDKLAMKVSELAFKLSLKAGEVYPKVKQYQTDAIEVLKKPKSVLDNEEKDEVSK